jgi:hypothetical protein
LGNVILTGAIPIAIPIGFVFLEALPETIANIIFYLILLAFLAGIISSIVLARRQPKKAIRLSRARAAHKLQITLLKENS